MELENWMDRDGHRYHRCCWRRSGYTIQNLFFEKKAQNTIDVVSRTLQVQWTKYHTTYRSGGKKSVSSNMGPWTSQQIMGIGIYLALIYK